MRKPSLLSAGLALALLAGCAAPVPQETAAPAPTPEAAAPSPEATAPPLPTNYFHTLCYLRPTVYLDKAVMDTQGYPLTCSFEIPKFEETTEGYRAINAFFQDLRDAFFDPKGGEGSAQAAWDSVTSAGDPDYRYFYERSVRVLTQTDTLVSVYLDWYWYMGGVNDTGGDCYNFDPATGARLYLSDLIAQPEDKTLALIRSVIKENGYEGTYVEGRALDSFDFYVDEGKVFLQFDRYEITIGAGGSPVLELPVKLK